MNTDIDVYCWVCEHHWRYHCDRGCYYVINRPEAELMGKPLKRCACEEKTNKAKPPVIEFTN